MPRSRNKWSTYTLCPSTITILIWDFTSSRDFSIPQNHGVWESLATHLALFFPSRSQMAPLWDCPFWRVNYRDRLFCIDNFHRVPIVHHASYASSEDTEGDNYWDRKSQVKYSQKQSTKVRKVWCMSSLHTNRCNRDPPWGSLQSFPQDKHWARLVVGW